MDNSTNHDKRDDTKSIPLTRFDLAQRKLIDEICSRPLTEKNMLKCFIEYPDVNLWLLPYKKESPANGVSLKGGRSIVQELLSKTLPGYAKSCEEDVSHYYAFRKHNSGLDVLDMEKSSQDNQIAKVIRKSRRLDASLKNISLNFFSLFVSRMGHRMDEKMMYETIKGLNTRNISFEEKRNLLYSILDVQDHLKGELCKKELFGWIAQTSTLFMPKNANDQKINFLKANSKLCWALMADAISQLESEGIKPLIKKDPSKIFSLLSQQEWPYEKDKEFALLNDILNGGSGMVEILAVLNEGRAVPIETVEMLMDIINSNPDSSLKYHMLAYEMLKFIGVMEENPVFRENFLKKEMKEEDIFIKIMRATGIYGKDINHIKKIVTGQSPKENSPLRRLEDGEIYRLDRSIRDVEAFAKNIAEVKKLTGIFERKGLEHQAKKNRPI